MFRSLLSDDIKQDPVTTTAHTKRLIGLLKEQTLLTLALSTIWEILMVVNINIDVLQHYILCHFCPNVYNLSFVKL